HRVCRRVFRPKEGNTKTASPNSVCLCISKCFVSNTSPTRKQVLLSVYFASRPPGGVGGLRQTGRLSVSFVARCCLSPSFVALVGRGYKGLSKQDAANGVKRHNMAYTVLKSAFVRFYLFF
ncbi:unnamed protein product, partial [Ixodes pacificus]